MSKQERSSINRHRLTRARFSTVIYTLFGAYIIPRGGEVHVADLIKLVRPLGFSHNAIRLGLSRMFRHGAFKIRRAGRRSYYSLSSKGMEWMEHGRMRAFDAEHKKWDRKWRLVVYNVPEKLRSLRDELRVELCDLGFASLAPSVWISPHDLCTKIVCFISDRGMKRFVEIFEADYAGFCNMKEFATTTWNIDALEKRYFEFIRKYEALRSKFEGPTGKRRQMDPAECFAERFCMTAEYVALKLDDPMLPLVLLPKDWVGLKAEKVHDTVWRMLKPAAEEFISAVLKK